MKSTQKKRNVHGRRKKLASPNARDTNMLVFFALGNAKVLSFALADAKVPNASSFEFWWNIGLRGAYIHNILKVYLKIKSFHLILANGMAC